MTQLPALKFGIRNSVLLSLITAGLMSSPLQAQTSRGASRGQTATTVSLQQIGGTIGLGASNTGSAYCFGDGTGITCPCSNFGATGTGCANTAGTGARLTASGDAYLSADTFRFSVNGAPGNGSGAILSGYTQLNGGLGASIGGGILCAGVLTRLSHVQFTTNGVCEFSQFGPGGFGASSYGMGVPTNYQFWYRDPQENCSGLGFNFSNAWTVTWMP